MSIYANVDAWDNIRNFEMAWLGPGVYVLFDGRPCDKNIVYIGKSVSDMMLRLDKHHTDKDFTNVGLILPRTVHDVFIHNLEHLVVAEFIDQFEVLPPYNHVVPRLHYTSQRTFDWHNISRRSGDAKFS